MQSTFAVLAELNRRRSLDELSQRERSAGEMVERLAEIDAWVAPYRRFWAEWLDALQAHLEQEQL